MCCTLLFFGHFIALSALVAERSKMIVTGDASQVDLPGGTRSGLRDALEKLKGIKGIGIVELGKSDIVRHRLVQNIVNAYERAGGANDSGEERE